MSHTLDAARVSYVRHLELADKSPQTIAAYGRHLAEFQDWFDAAPRADEIQSSDAEGFLLDLKRRPKLPGHQHRSKPKGRLSAETRRHYYFTLRSFFGWAKKRGLLNGHKPMDGVPKLASNEPETSTLSKQEVGRLLALLNKPEVKKRTLFVAFWLMASLGLRISEVCNLRLVDANLETGLLYVKGKGKKPRKLPIPGGLRNLLHDYVSDVRAICTNGSDRLLVSYTGSALLPSSLRKSFKRYGKRAKLPATATPHTLHHSFATQFIRDGGSVCALKRILGHKDIKTTERYVHAASTQDMAAALDRMDWA